LQVGATPELDRRENITEAPNLLTRPGQADNEAGRRNPPPETDDDYPPPRRFRVGLADLSADYEINLNEWFSYASEHYGAVLGPMIGYMLIYGLLSMGLHFIPCLGILVSVFLDPPLQAGFTVVCLAQLKGKRWEFGDFFAGFNWYGQLLGNFFLSFVIVLGTMIPGIVIAVVVTSTVPYSDGAMLALVGVELLCVCPAVYVIVRATCFNVFLILDRGVSPVEAIKGSWQLSRGHFWGLFGVSLLLGLLLLIGFLLCGVGILFTGPLVMLTSTAGYLLIAGTQPPVRLRAAGQRDLEDAKPPGSGEAK